MRLRPTPETDCIVRNAANNHHPTSRLAATLTVKCEKLERERDEAREALDRIARPVWWMQEDQKRKTGSINGISGGMALALSEDAEYLKGIARSALRGEAK